MIRLAQIIGLSALALLGAFITWLSFWVAFRVMPGYVVWTCLALMASVCVWLLARKRTQGVVGSETALLGRQSSKAGLL